jgi:Tfp pilus assembly protein PilW
MYSKTTFTTKTQKTIKLLISTLTSMIIILAVIFFVTTNQSAQKGYTLQQEKLKNEELKSINLNLITKITQATAFTQLEENEKLKDMQAIEEKNYVTSEDNSVY